MTTWTVTHGDCRVVMAGMEAATVSAIVCDPPYGLSFMGKGWDHGVPGVEFWTEALRVAKPGAHLVAFGGTRTFHRLTCAIEDAGWEIRDCLSWLYGSGFPKSLDVSKAMDKHGGAPPSWFGPWFRQWREQNGITQKQVAALFPSKTGNVTGCVANWELGFNLPTPGQFNLIRDTFGLPFQSIYEAEREVLATKRDAGKRTVAILGTEAKEYDITAPATDLARQWQGWGTALKPAWEPIILARKPLAGTVAATVAAHGTGALNVDGCRIGTDSTRRPLGSVSMWGRDAGAAVGGSEAGRWPANVVLDEDAAAMLGEPARFFYTAKASRREREAGTDGNGHPTVKPIALMRWLVRLVTPPGGLVLDPFCGSGSTGCAAVLEGQAFHGIEQDAEYVEIARRRVAHWAGTVRAEVQPDLFTRDDSEAA